MEYLPPLSPSSCSDETLIGTPDTPSKKLSDDFWTVSLVSTATHAFAPSLEQTIPTSATDEFASFSLSRRNAISSQSSNDDTILCHGPAFGAVFGNVSGGVGSLQYNVDDFTPKRSMATRTQDPCTTTAAAQASPSLAYYLSPTYGLPTPVTSEREREEFFLNNQSAFDDDSTDEEREGEKEKCLCRSPASLSLSSFLDAVPVPPSRMDKQRSMPRAIRQIEANKQFFMAVHSSDAPAFALTLPMTRAAREERRNALSSSRRVRQASQRVMLQEVALQAERYASAQRPNVAS